MMDFSALNFNVSRETSERLEIFQSLLTKWNKKINLIGKNTLPVAAVRHFLDSAQLWSYRSNGGVWLDMGSGAGFPGLVLAIINRQMDSPYQFHLVESDARKCAFLRTVSRETETEIKIHALRIERADAIQADIVSARALASVSELMEYTIKHMKPAGFALYLKGQNCEEELIEAQRSWQFQSVTSTSISDPNARVLKVWELQRATKSDGGR
ncbi:MAG: 16S rRNA (guanine(527)-N(7))-methyltransferase RsmG [Pseudomonadota bacterium]